jgi:preprotein translocase subunit SecE
MANYLDQIDRENNKVVQRRELMRSVIGFVLFLVVLGLVLYSGWVVFTPTPA